MSRITNDIRRKLIELTDLLATTLPMQAPRWRLLHNRDVLCARIDMTVVLLTPALFDGLRNAYGNGISIGHSTAPAFVWGNPHDLGGCLTVASATHGANTHRLLITVAWARDLMRYGPMVPITVEVAP